LGIIVQLFFRKKKMKLIFPTLLSIVLVVGCLAQNSRYNQLFHSIHLPSGLVNHFPLDVDDSITFRFYFNTEPVLNKFTSKLVFIYLEIEYDNIDSIISLFDKKKIAQYKFSDSCNLTLNNFQRNSGYSSYYGKEWLYENWLNECQDSFSGKYPIPNFIGVGDIDHRDDRGISDGYDIYVIESKQGQFFEDRYYSNPIIMPENWKRGHSKGLAIDVDTKKVIYWSVVW